MLRPRNVLSAIVALLIFCGAVWKIGPVSIARVVAGRDGRSDASLGIDPCCNDGRSWRLHAGARGIHHPSVDNGLLVVAMDRHASPAVMGGVIATQQDDIKRILAYSTLSQLGYMVMAWVSHRTTPPYFTFSLTRSSKRSSSWDRFRHRDASPRTEHLGNGRTPPKIPNYIVTFTVGALALMGCPPFSGFFSKDGILALAYQRNLPIFAVALFTAFLTAFYGIRMLVIVFFGDARSDTRARAAKHRRS